MKNPWKLPPDYKTFTEDLTRRKEQQPCLHEQMSKRWREQNGDAPEPVHMISCPCPRCTPRYSL